MSKTKKLFGIFMIICMVAMGLIIYMICTLGSSKNIIKDFKLVGEKSGDWDESVVADLEARITYQFPDYEKAEFTYKNGKVTDIEIEKADEQYVTRYSDGRQRDDVHSCTEGEMIHHSYYNNENNQYILVGITSEEKSYTLHVYVMDDNAISTLKQSSYTFGLDEETIKANRLLEDKAEDQNIKASDYVQANGVTNGTTLITVTQICGYQDIINISYEEDENGMIKDIKFSKIDSNEGSKVYMSTLLDVCEDKDGTMYVCYLEGLKDKEPEYTDYWARRMIVDGSRWRFEENSDKGIFFWNEGYATRFRFNGIGVRAYKNVEEKSEIVYYGYFESEISKLFVENIELVRNGNEIRPREIDVYLVDLKLSVEG